MNTMAQSAEITPNIKFFQTLQENFAIVGIRSNQSIQKSPFNRRNSVALFMHSILVVLSLLYVLYDAHSFQEYTNGLYSVLAFIVSVICFIIIIWTTDKWFEFIEFLENTVNKSELNFFLINQCNLNSHFELLIVLNDLKVYKTRRNA